MRTMLELIITDFDGTLVDTFEANFKAYERAFADLNFILTPEEYRVCFGYRFDDFMKSTLKEVIIETPEITEIIRNKKKKYYPEYFEYLKPNFGLLNLIHSFQRAGGKTAVASTAARPNLMNALAYIGAVDDFDLILSGESVAKGKPDPEIYLKVLDYFKITPESALVFEDSEIGCEAAAGALIPYIQIKSF